MAARRLGKGAPGPLVAAVYKDQPVRGPAQDGSLATHRQYPQDDLHPKSHSLQN